MQPQYAALQYFECLVPHSASVVWLSQDPFLSYRKSFLQPSLPVYLSATVANVTRLHMGRFLSPMFWEVRLQMKADFAFLNLIFAAAPVCCAPVLCPCAAVRPSSPGRGLCARRAGRIPTSGPSTRVSWWEGGPVSAPECEPESCIFLFRNSGISSLFAIISIESVDNQEEELTKLGARVERKRSGRLLNVLKFETFELVCNCPYYISKLKRRKQGSLEW